MAQVEALLDRGPSGYLELVHLLDDEVFWRLDLMRDRDMTGVGDRIEVAWVALAARHAHQVPDILETVFATAVSEPALVDDLSWRFVEELAGAARYAHAFARPDQVAAIQSYAATLTSGELESAAQWEDAANAVLDIFGFPPDDEDADDREDELYTLARLDPRSVSSDEAVLRLVAALEREGGDALLLVERFDLPPAAIARIDDAIVDGIAGYEYQPEDAAIFRIYLEGTHRTDWASMAPFVERARAAAADVHVAMGMADAMPQMPEALRAEIIEAAGVDDEPSASPFVELNTLNLATPFE